MKHFQDYEFECQCDYECGLDLKDVDQRAVEMLDLARAIAGVAFILNRAVSCERHNEFVGGIPNSSHLAKPKATGFDIKARDSHIRFRIVYGLIKAGFKRILIYPTFIHADDDPNKPQEILVVK